MLVHELMEEKEENAKWGRDENYEDLVTRITKIMGKPTKQNEDFKGALKHTYWAKSDKKGEHVSVSFVNGHLGLTVIYKGPWYKEHIAGGPWSANAKSTNGVADLIKKIKNTIKATIKKSKDRGYASYRNEDYDVGPEAKKAEEFLTKMMGEIK